MPVIASIIDKFFIDFKRGGFSIMYLILYLLFSS